MGIYQDLQPLWGLQDERYVAVWQVNPGADRDRVATGSLKEHRAEGDIGPYFDRGKI